MSIEDRAIQFAPFSLKDYEKNVRESITKFESRIELYEETKEQIFNTILSLNINDRVRICYYNFNEYITNIMSIKSIDYKNNILIFKEMNICFDDIYNIQILEE